MIIKVDLSSVRSTTLGEYATRFVFGGVVTVLAGLIADKFGPSTGGLFLAFPAIFPAGASLIEKHQQEKKRRAGMNGKQRGRLASGVDAAGAAMGSLALMGFATVAWKLLPRYALWQTLVLAMALWVVVAISVLFTHKRWC
jgi:Protein of unknown function (DUF3147)